MAKESWRKMAWDKHQNRWYKRLGKRIRRYSLLPGEVPMSRASHDRCYKIWLAEKEKADREATDELTEAMDSLREYRRASLTTALRLAKRTNQPALFHETLVRIAVETHKRKSGEYVDDNEVIVRPWDFPHVFGLEIGEHEYDCRQPLQIMIPEPATVEVSETTVGALADRYLEHTGLTTSKGYLVNLTRWVNRFRDFIGSEKEIAEITDQDILNYHSNLMNDVRAEKLTGTTADGFQKTVNRFFHWCYSCNYLKDKPRVLATNQLRIPKETPSILTFTKEETKAMFQQSSGRNRLALLLGLNCGMTPKDIVELPKEDIDLENGLLTRTRGKTKHVANAPTIVFRLWPETVESIRDNLGNHDVYAFTSEQSIKCGKDIMSADLWSIAFKKLMKKCQIKNNRSQKNLRKTGASTLREHETYMMFSEVFLVHTPKSVSDRHYSKVSEKLFHAALDWLRGEVLSVEG